MKIVEFNRGPDKGDVASALKVLDGLREAVASGRIVCVAAVGIRDDDVTEAWICTSKRVSRLRTMGAIASLQHEFHAGNRD